MTRSEELKNELKDLRMKLAFTKDEIRKKKLNEQLKIVRNNYTNALLEEKFDARKKGR